MKQNKYSKMNKIYILGFIILVASSCNSNKDIQTQQVNSTTSNLTINIPESIRKDDKLKIEIVNETTDTFTLINPMIKIIEKLDNKEWVLQRILYCPCGANCQPSIPRLELTKNQNQKLEWALKEAWCEKNSNGDLITVTKNAEPGTYRIVVKYERIKFQTEIIYKEFVITK
jgi:hypothetical protein